MTSEKNGLVVDITGFKCPVPLIKTRRALKQSPANQIIKFIGTEIEEISRKEILIALENMKQEILSINIEDNGDWVITIKKQTEN
jgi:TusA-related sulfurtransferase